MMIYITDLMVMILRIVEVLMMNIVEVLMMNIGVDTMIVMIVIKITDMKAGKIRVV